MERLGLEPDVKYAGGRHRRGRLVLHRRLEDGDIYFLSNRRPRIEQLEVQFRVTGEYLNSGNADTGIVQPSSYRGR